MVVWYFSPDKAAHFRDMSEGQRAPVHSVLRYQAIASQVNPQEGLTTVRIVGSSNALWSLSLEVSNFNLAAVFCMSNDRINIY